MIRKTKFQILILFLLVPILIFLPAYFLQNRYFTDGCLQINALGEKNDNACAYEVWIKEIEVNGKNVDLKAIELSEGWEYINDGICAVSGEHSSLLEIPLKNIEYVKMTFIKHGWCGKAEVRLLDNISKIDLYSDKVETLTLEFDGKCIQRPEGLSLFSLKFLLFLGLTIILYFLIGRKNSSKQWIVLLLVSYVFYASTGIYMLLPIVITTVMTWAGALIIEKVSDYYKELGKGQSSDEKKKIKSLSTRRKRQLLAAVVVLNLGILIVFKYTNFFIENFNEISGNDIAAIKFWVPIGLSFYTFQSIGYLIDIYRGKYRADKKLFQFALFVSYFPQIIQGPISRYDQLAKQLYEPHKFEYTRVKFGIQRMLWGYFKKMVIADRVAIFVNEVFSAFTGTSVSNAQYVGIVVFLSALFYGIQIYADFSGGMDIVIGISQIFGIELVENFRRPFMARSVAEFWQRWHITLGAWMRDYLFYPLALSKPFGALAKKLRKLCGNYVAKILPTCLASFIVFFLIGVWHGADWKYIIYGIYQAIFVSTATLLEPFYTKCRNFFRINVECQSWRIFQTLRTVLLITIGRYYSRADSADAAFNMLKATVTKFNPWVLFDGSLYNYGIDQKNFTLMIISIAFLFTIDFIQERGIHIRNEIAKFDIVLRWTIYFIGIFSIIIFGIYGLGFDSANFIYQGF